MTACLIAVAALLAQAAAADASATVYVHDDSGTSGASCGGCRFFEYDGSDTAAEDDRIVLSHAGTTSSFWSFSTLGSPVTLTFAGPAGGSCTPVTGGYRCNTTYVPENAYFSGGPGDDLADYTGVALRVPTTVGELYRRVQLRGGPGNDTLKGGSTKSRADLIGDEGNDTIYGGPRGDDSLDGGDDNDVLVASRRVAGGNAGDEIIGGAGTDTVDFSAFADRVDVSLDGQPNDGATGDATNVLSGIEVVWGSNLGDVLKGAAAAETLRGLGGPDEITGAGGPDNLQGGADSDTIYAKDGAVDTIDCGTGNDTAFVDANDKVTSCESAPGLDLDGDGVQRDAGDCNDGDAAIKPGATDVPGNGVDEDCNGADAVAAPVTQTQQQETQQTPPSGGPTTPTQQGTPAVQPAAIGAKLKTSFKRIGKGTLVRTLTVSGLPAGAKVTVACKGASCPFKSKAGKVKKGSAALAPLFKKRALKAGVVVEVTVTAPGYANQVVRYAMRKGKAPVKS